MKLQIKVIPSSSKDGIVGWLEDTLKIKVKQIKQSSACWKNHCHYPEAVSLLKAD